MIFITIGAKRDATFRKWINGVSVMYDKKTGERFGYAIISGLLPSGEIELPLKAKPTIEA